MSGSVFQGAAGQGSCAGSVFSVPPVLNCLPQPRELDGIFVIREWFNFFPWNVKWLVFLSWIVIFVNRDSGCVLYYFRRKLTVLRDRDRTSCSFPDFFSLRAEQEADGWLRHLTRLCLGVTFKYYKLRQLGSKIDMVLKPCPPPPPRPLHVRLLPPSQLVEGQRNWPKFNSYQELSDFSRGVKSPPRKSYFSGNRSFHPMASSPSTSVRLGWKFKGRCVKFFL